MFGFMVTADGGLTTAGYVITVIAGIILFFLAIYFAGKNSDKKKLTTRQLVFCAVAIALAFITSYLKIFKLPWGGSVTLCSMLFIVLIANWYGVGTGIMAGFAYGILQFIQEPYILSFFQVCCDYILAFAALGLAGLFAKQSHGLLKGYIIAVIARGAFHSLGGYLYWMSYMPDNFPKSLTAVYPILQLQLSTGRGHYHGNHHFSTCGVEGTDPGKACRTAVVCFVWQQGCVVARYSEHLVW